MDNNVGNKTRVLVLTSTFPRWKNDPEPAFVYELSRRLSDKFNVKVFAPRSGVINQQTDTLNSEAKDVLSYQVDL